MMMMMMLDATKAFDRVKTVNCFNVW